jgi:hypothetical protein
MSHMLALYVSEFDLPEDSGNTDFHEFSGINDNFTKSLLTLYYLVQLS